MTHRWLAAVAGAVIAFAAAAYLHDPPWIGGVTSGLSNWQIDASGRRFRWTQGRASFYVPSDAGVMTLPLRAAAADPGGTRVVVNVSIDDRSVTEVTLTDPSAWVRVRLPIPQRRTGRRFRRVDLRISRTIDDSGRGVQAGEAALEPPARSGVATIDNR